MPTENRLWSKMSNDNLIHYVRSWHFGDGITEFARSKGEGRVYQQCLNRKLINCLVEEGTLIRGKTENNSLKNMTNDNLIHYVRSWHFGDSIGEFARSKGDGAKYHECRKRGLIDGLVEEGTLKRRKRKNGTWCNRNDNSLIHYVRSWHFGDTLTEFQKSKDSTAHDECINRGLIDGLVEEGTLIREQRKDGFWKNMNNDNLIHYVRSWHFGDSITEFQKSKRDCSGYEECRKRGLIDGLVEEGTLIRENRKEGILKDLDYVIKQVEEVKKITNTKNLPTQPEFCSAGFSSIVYAISKFHGGGEKFMRIMAERKGHKAPTREEHLKRIIENRKKALEALTKTAYYVEGRFYTQSQQEGAVALLLEKYLPKTYEKVDDGRNFQVRDKGISNGGIDFLVDGEFLEWHPIVLYSGGGIPKEERPSYYNVLKELTEEEKAEFKQQYSEILAMNYFNRRQASVDNSEYKGANVILARTERELYDFISKHGAQLPDYDKFKQEFKAKIKYVKTFKVEKVKGDAA